MQRLLLISSSYVYGAGYLDHCWSEIADFLGPIKKLLFIPYALRDFSGYVEQVRKRFRPLGIAIVSIHELINPTDAILDADGIFTGGGNTFRLLKTLNEYNLIGTLKSKINDGTAYIGSSAGINIAGPSIKTTNDMPIVCPPNLDSLGLVPFNLNPHYLEKGSSCESMMETRDDRISQFHEENDIDVLALAEAVYLRREGSSLMLRGKGKAKFFRKQMQPIEYYAPNDLSLLLIERM